MQIYKDILTMQVLESNPAMATTFALKGNRFQPSYKLLQLGDPGIAFLVHLLSNLGPSVRPAQSKGLSIDEEIFDLVTVDLSAYCNKTARKHAYYKRIAEMIDNNVMRKQGYHGHVYTVNPYIMNRLKGKHCKHLKAVMLELLASVPVVRPTLTQ